MSFKTTKNGYVKLYSTSVLYQGEIRKVPISLVYKVKGDKPIHMDIMAFRPDPSLQLDEGKEYQAVLEFDSMWFPCDSGGADVQILRYVTIPKKHLKFSNVR